MIAKGLRIVENSFLARVARWVLKADNVAMVLGKSIHLSGVGRDTFLQNHAWVAHECCHLRQFRQYGFFRFLGLYLIESMKVGYYRNKFEVEARQAAVQKIIYHENER